MSVIIFDHVTKHYQVKETAEGIGNAFRSFFCPNYKTIHAVQDISFNIDRGHILGLIGENGAGKTTIVKLVCGILSSDTGKIEVLGMDPFQKLRDFKQRVSLLLGNKINYGGIFLHTSPFLLQKNYMVYPIPNIVPL